MDEQAVSCTIKPAVYLSIGGAEAAARSGVCVLDVHLPFGRTVNVRCCAQRRRSLFSSLATVHAGYRSLSTPQCLLRIL